MSRKIYGIPVSTPINPAKVKPDVPEEQIASNVAAYMERNPVTPSGIGLGNVDNTADKDKPVSTAQAVAIADAKKAGTDAQTAANNAQTSANNAKAAADNAQTAADNAQQAANDAVNAAGNAQTDADNAQQAADNAQTSANNAQTAADNAQAAANNAQTSANNAQTSADNAQASANNAQNVIDTHIADKNNPHKVTCEQIGATSIEVIWENASPTSYFASDTIRVDWSKYDKIAIQYSMAYTEMEAKLGSMCVAAYYTGNDNGSVVVNYRQADVVSDGILISVCHLLTIYGYLSGYDRLTPLKIYGISFGNKVEDEPDTPDVPEVVYGMVRNNQLNNTTPSVLSFGITLAEIDKIVFETYRLTKDKQNILFGDGSGVWIGYTDANAEAFTFNGVTGSANLSPAEVTDGARHRIEFNVSSDSTGEIINSYDTTDRNWAKQTGYISVEFWKGNTLLKRFIPSVEDFSSEGYCKFMVDTVSGNKIRVSGSEYVAEVVAG